MNIVRENLELKQKIKILESKLQNQTSNDDSYNLLFRIGESLSSVSGPGVSFRVLFQILLLLSRTGFFNVFSTSRCWRRRRSSVPTTDQFTNRSYSYRFPGGNYQSINQFFNESMFQRLIFKEVVDEEPKKGGNKCFNCLGDHMMFDCPNPRDQKEINKNKKEFAMKTAMFNKNR